MSALKTGDSRSMTPEYGYSDASAPHTVSYLLPAIAQLLPENKGLLLDVGCGKGYYTAEIGKSFKAAIGIEASEDAVRVASAAYPNIRFQHLEISQDSSPASQYDICGQLQIAQPEVILSSEVIEHLYNPRKFLEICHGALRPGGRLILTTPYHGWLKNTCLSLAGKWDSHHNPNWYGGHVKFWSRNSLFLAMRDCGFTNLQFRGAGRLPYLWCSMVVSGDKLASARNL